MFSWKTSQLLWSTPGKSGTSITWIYHQTLQLRIDIRTHTYAHIYAQAEINTRTFPHENPCHAVLPRYEVVSLVWPSSQPLLMPSDPSSESRIHRSHHANHCFSTLPQPPRPSPPMSRPRPPRRPPSREPTRPPSARSEPRSLSTDPRPLLSPVPPGTRESRSTTCPGWTSSGLSSTP